MTDIINGSTTVITFYTLISYYGKKQTGCKIDYKGNVVVSSFVVLFYSCTYTIAV
jgi:hypothetical protein